MATLVSRLVDLPGINPARVDASIIVCIRIETAEQGSYVIAHTNEGFAFGLVPDKDQSVNAFYKEILAIVWPMKKG